MTLGSQITDKISINNNIINSDKYSYMFYNSNATNLNLSSFNTSNVTDMSYMFYQSKATSIDLSNFDTSNVTSVENMFCDAACAKTVDISHFDLSKSSDKNYILYCFES